MEGDFRTLNDGMDTIDDEMKLIVESHTSRNVLSFLRWIFPIQSCSTQTSAASTQGRHHAYAVCSKVQWKHENAAPSRLGHLSWFSSDRVKGGVCPPFPRVAPFGISVSGLLATICKLLHGATNTSVRVNQNTKLAEATQA